MIGWQVNCNECGRRCVTRQNLKNHKFLMMSQLQWYGKRCGTTHNLKSHKLSDEESIAMNRKDAGQHTIWKFTNDWMTT